MNFERLAQIILGPCVTEKTARLAELKNRQFAFKVRTDANKLEIKQAIEKFFSVKVIDVKTLGRKGKACRFGQYDGRHQNWKKAYITLAEGQDITFDGAE